MRWISDAYSLSLDRANQSHTTLLTAGPNVTYLRKTLGLPGQICVCRALYGGYNMVNSESRLLEEAS